METIYKGNLENTKHHTWTRKYDDIWMCDCVRIVLTDEEINIKYIKGELSKSFIFSEDKIQSNTREELRHIYNLCTYDDLDADEKIDLIIEYIKEIII